MMENVKLVIFDMDGLMFDTEMMYLKFAPGAAKELGYNIKEEIFKKTVGTNQFINVNANRKIFETDKRKANDFSKNTSKSYCFLFRNCTRKFE